MSSPSASAAPSSAPSAGWVGEVWGGFAAMLVALPSAIAFGVAVYALLGPEYVASGVRSGILGAIVLGLVASFIGGAPRLISAPCAPAAAVLAALCAEALSGSKGPVSPDRLAALLVLVALLSGVLQTLYGLSGGGRLIKYIPYPVVSGYLSAVGVIIFLGQFPKFLGLASGTPLLTGISSPAVWQWPAIVVGLATIAGVLLAPKVTRKVPAPIIGLTIGVAVYFALSFVRPELLTLEKNKLVIGPIGGDLSTVIAGLSGPWAAITGLRWSDLSALIVPALTLSVLLSVDTLKTCVVVDALTRTRHDSNRVLLSQGIGNTASAFLGGFPGAGTMGATLVNLDSGGKTRLSGMLEGGFVLAAFLVFGRWIAWVPVAALAGILLVVAVRMVDWHSFQLLRQRATMLDFTVIATVVVVAVSTNLIAAAGAGVAFAIVLFLREQIQTSVIRRKVSGEQMSSKLHRLPEDQAILKSYGAQTVVCELQGNLFFGTTDQLYNELEPELKRCRYLILDLRRVKSVDFSAAHLLEQFQARLGERQGFLLFSRLPASLPSGQNLEDYFKHVGVMERRSNVLKFETLDDALEWTENRILAEQKPPQSDDSKPLELAEFDLFREFVDDGTLAVVAECVEEHTFQAGQTIFCGGDADDRIFLIRTGVVRIVLPLKDAGYHNLASMGRGNFFGEMAFLHEGVRSATSVAAVETMVYGISRKRFDEVSRRQPLAGVKVFARLARALARRLRRTDIEVRALYEW